jgi:hypothetical protein
MDDLMDTDACTLPTVERPFRLAEFDSLFTEAVRSVHSDGGRVTMRLTGDPGLRGRVQDLARRESACCSFFSFVVEGTESDLKLEITVPPERRDILTALADRAARLSA